MTADRANLLLSLVEANKNLAAAHAAARRLGNADLASYISDLAADVNATRAGAERAVGVAS